MQSEIHHKFVLYKCCVLIPTYNNAATLADVIDSVLEYTSNIVVVNDGSADDTRQILERFPQILIVHHPINQGKGMALRTGFKEAFARGYHYAITIDSDGQHYADDLTLFIDQIETHPNAIIMGARNMDQATVPGKSSIGNKFSSFWFRVITGIDLPDTQSGYRLYPLIPINKIKFFTYKYEFEIEVMVRSAWSGVDIFAIPVKVYYPPASERITHFRPFTDVTRITMLNTIFVLLAAFWFHPIRLIKNFSYKVIKKKLYEYTFGTSEPNHIKALSIAFGVFMGIAPFWGYQMLMAIALAHFFKLNKVLVLISANISLPPFIPFILYFSNYLGAVVLGNSTDLIFSSDITLAEIGKYLYQYIFGSFLLAFLSASLFFLIAYVILSLANKKNAS